MCDPRKLKVGKLYFVLTEFLQPKTKRENKSYIYFRDFVKYPAGTAALYIGQIKSGGGPVTHEFLINDELRPLSNSSIRTHLVTSEFYQNFNDAFFES